jgi:pimeloyl-ACP methyl ester carboxylesterase
MAIRLGKLATAGGHTLVYEKTDGAGPGIVFLHGLNSDRRGNKANALQAYCSARGYSFLRFDMFGHGESSGRFEDGGPTRWRDDAVALLDAVTDGPQILVGSSMGGWVMLLTALARPQRMGGLIGIAAAPDFTADYASRSLTPAQRTAFERDGYVDLPPLGDERPMRIGRHLVDDGNRNLLLTGPIPLACPVRLLHGQRDDSVPWQLSMQLADTITGGDVEVTLVKDGDHRLSTPRDLALLQRELDRMVETVRT